MTKETLDKANGLQRKIESIERVLKYLQNDGLNIIRSNIVFEYDTDYVRDRCYDLPCSDDVHNILIDFYLNLLKQTKKELEAL